MCFVTRKLKKEDEEVLKKHGVVDKYGNLLNISKDVLESTEKKIMMVNMGGQGIMNEDGTEWSETAIVCLIIWNDKRIMTEYYSHKKWFKPVSGYDIFEAVYKIKKIYFSENEEYKKEDALEIVKECIARYDIDNCVMAKCKKVTYLNDEMRWV